MHPEETLRLTKVSQLIAIQKPSQRNLAIRNLAPQMLRKPVQYNLDHPVLHRAKVGDPSQNHLAEIASVTGNHAVDDI